MGTDDLVGPVGNVGRGLFFGDYEQFIPYVMMDISRAQLRAEGAAIVADEALRERRDEKLRQLGAREVFPAGSVLVVGEDGSPRPRPVVVAVTEDELVLLSASRNAPDEEVARIPQRDVSEVRLLDQRGEPARPLTEVEELDAPPQRYTLWVDRKGEGASSTGNAFLFLSYGVAAEAERDFRRQLPA